MKINGFGLYEPLNGINRNEYFNKPADNKVVISEADMAAGDRPREEPSAQEGRRLGSDVSEMAYRFGLYGGFGAIDRLAGIGNTDVNQAVLDMEKDESLAQYRYFVGESPVINDSEDGVVIQKSGFDY